MSIPELVDERPLGGTGRVELSALPDLLVQIRRHLHRHPEIGLHEYETSRFIREMLERHGLKVHRPLARTGLYVDIKGDHPGPMVAYRADIDALPIQDTKTVDYASTVPGIAHLCGHDAHTTIAIGTALLLDSVRMRLHGTVRVFFQPNEEGIPSGAPLMIRDGVLKGVEAAYASHVDPTLAVRRFGLIKGPATASADRFRVTVVGPSTGHSARPHQAVDTIWVTTQIMNALYQQIGRRTDARNPAVFAICRLNAGEAYNVIPEKVEFGGTFRCTATSDRKLIKELMISTASAIGAMYGARVDIEFDHGSPPVVNDETLIDIARGAITGLFGMDAVHDIPQPSMGAEDFAHYQEHVPGALIRIGTASGPATSHVLHDSSFDIDEAALMPAVELISETLTRYLALRTAG